MGCGGCATVCPSGAMTYAYPRMSDLGARLKRVLSVYHAAGGKDAALLFHNGTDGREAIAKLARRGKGLPARVIPLEIHHVASIGLDVMLGAIAYGASQVLLLSCGSEAEGYGHSSAKQMGFGETILAALGYAGEHFRWIEAHDTAALERAIWSLAPARSVAKAATFNLGSEKRTTLDFALDHLARHAPTPQAETALGAGAPFGALAVNQQKCTMCMACVGACPESALLDGGDAPRLRFIERNCVQCGLCVNTCPENALSLVPRLLLAPAAKEAVTINAAEPFHCSKCGKPFGTKQMIDSMLGRLAGHSMWQGQVSLKRLTMCADCRVVDMMENRNEVTIFDVK
jgi:ferredoxin